MPLTLPADELRVEITATKVLPETGGVVNATLKLANELAPVLPVALCTRVTVEPDTSDCSPTFFPGRLTLPVNTRSAPSRLLDGVIIPAAAVLVPS